MSFIWPPNIKVFNGSLYNSNKKGNEVSRITRKPVFAHAKKTKDADQPGGDCAADQCLCFHYIDGTIPLLPKSKF